MADEIRSICLQDVELGYCVHGFGAGKPPLIFVHGGLLRATGDLYDPLLRLLTEDYEVYALDLRGHGASARAVAGWSLAALADDIAAFARALHLNQPVYVGHSLSAFVGLFAFLRHSGLFSAICLMAPGPADPRNDPVEALDFLIENKSSQQTMRRAFSQMFVRKAGPQLDLMMDAISLVDTNVLRALREQNLQSSIEDRLMDVTTPVLMICGERDNVIPLERQHAMARQLPCCKKVDLSNEGHMFPNENPVITSREILAFLEHDVEAMKATLDGDRTTGLKTHSPVDV